MTGPVERRDGDDLPTITPGERLERAFDLSTSAPPVARLLQHAAHVAAILARPVPLDDAASRLRRVEVFLAEPSVQDLLCDLWRMWRPATRAEIGTAIAFLVGAFAGKPGNGRVFGTALADDVGALGPSLLAVDIAARELRRTKVFLPSIAEALDAVAARGRSAARRRPDRGGPAGPHRRGARRPRRPPARPGRANAPPGRAALRRPPSRGGRLLTRWLSLSRSAVQPSPGRAVHLGLWESDDVSQKPPYDP